MLIFVVYRIMRNASNYILDNKKQMTYMKFRQFVHILALAMALGLCATSCVTPRKVNYLQDMTHESQIELENRFEAAISPYDELSIVVSAREQELAKPFNLGGIAGSSSNGASTYLVDVNGNIQFPVLGTIYVQGMTRLQLQEAIATRLEADGYIMDPFVQVRFSNFKIFFLGADGGKSITIANERCTFLEALALSGDLGLFTRRDKIAVLREVNGRMVMRYLDPRSSKVFDDPFFMLQQNDFIITQSVNGNNARSEVSYWLGWVSTGASFITMLTTLFIIKK